MEQYVMFCIVLLKTAFIWSVCVFGSCFRTLAVTRVSSLFDVNSNNHDNDSNNDVDFCNASSALGTACFTIPLYTNKKHNMKRTKLKWGYAQSTSTVI